MDREIEVFLGSKNMEYDENADDINNTSIQNTISECIFRKIIDFKNIFEVLEELGIIYMFKNKIHAILTIREITSSVYEYYCKNFKNIPDDEIYSYIDFLILNSNIKSRECRSHFTNYICWAIPSKDVIDNITLFINNDSALEIGAGRGLWSKLLKMNDITVKATDYFRGYSSHEDINFLMVEKLECDKALKKYGHLNVLILIWPPYNDLMAYRALKKFKGNKLVYVGEGEDGCTAEKKFFELLEDEWTLEDTIEIRTWRDMWFGDRVFLYVRKTL